MHHKIDFTNSDDIFLGKSSYIGEKFSKVLKSICLVKNPKKIVEFGILDGYSLDCFLEATDPSCIIEAYDIFDEFPYSSANYDRIKKKYEHSRASILRGDIFKSSDLFDDLSVDIFHVDVANNGEVYEYCITNLLPKMKNDGVMLLEGGSESRDNVEWMVKYNKPKIREILYKYSDSLKIKVFNEFPSLTIVQKIEK